MPNFLGSIVGACNASGTQRIQYKGPFLWTLSFCKSRSTKGAKFNCFQIISKVKSMLSMSNVVRPFCVNERSYWLFKSRDQLYQTFNFRWLCSGTKNNRIFRKLTEKFQCWELSITEEKKLNKLKGKFSEANRLRLVQPLENILQES